MTQPQSAHAVACTKARSVYASAYVTLATQSSAAMCTLLLDSFISWVLAHGAACRAQRHIQQHVPAQA